MAEPANARLTIDLDALAHNYALLSREAAGAEVAPVVKADGYGLGAGPLARRLWAEGARSFFVARLHEGESLRQALGARDAEIFVLDGLTAGAGSRLTAAQLTPVLATLPQVAAASALARQAGGRLPVALHLDSGMNRQGLTADEAKALAQGTDPLRGLKVKLVMSHLGSAPEASDPRNREQLATFRELRSLFPEARASLPASAGAFLGAEFRFDMVRPGVSLYGGGPSERPDGRLRAVAKLEAPILDIRNLRPGELLSYGDRLRVETPTRVGIVAAGYADGVIRAERDGGYAWYADGRRALLFVDMDLLGIDLGPAAAEVGGMVELLGPNALLDDLAAAAGTIAHEVLVRLSTRAERVYIGAA
jgi:alanine racemase